VSAVRVSLIVAADKGDTIGNEGQLPWHLPEDLKRFRALTMGHVLVAGRVTQDSIVARLGRALPGRTTVVVTRQPEPPEPPTDVHYAHSVDEALALAARLEERDGEVFVIGGAQIYRESLPRIGTVYLTRVHDTVPGDRAMPAGWLAAFGEPVERVERDGFAFETYERR
jgi:dihydrofolate reductase